MFSRKPFVSAACAVSRIVPVVIFCALCVDQVAVADAKQALRPEVGKPLQAAKTALSAKHYDEALAKLSEAQKVGNLSSYEKTVVTQVLAAIDGGKGDYKGAANAYEALLSSEHLAPADQQQMLSTLVKLDYSAKDYAKAADAVNKYRAVGGKDAGTLALLPQSDYLAGHFADAYKEASSEVASAEAEGQRPAEAELQLLASCALKGNDAAGYVGSLRKLALYYPTTDVWRDLITRTTSRQGFNDRLGLDVSRLRLQTGTLQSAAEYMEATELAVQAGLPAEADHFLKQGYSNKVLGVGAPGDIDRQSRLQNLVNARIASDKAAEPQAEKVAQTQKSGDFLVNAGLDRITSGDADGGLAMMNSGISKGGLKQSDDAKLHLGYAYFLASRKTDALKAFGSVRGDDGAQELANLWIIALKSAPSAAAKSGSKPGKSRSS